MAEATKAALIIFGVLLIAALGGRYILQAFGISMDAFRIVGGVIVVYIGFAMFTGKMHVNADSTAPSGSLGPVIMFAASPGTIATVITLSVVHNSFELPITALVAVTSAMAWTWIMMLSMIRFASHANKTVQRVSTQFMGLILVTMGLQFVLEGYKDFMST